MTKSELNPQRNKEKRIQKMFLSPEEVSTILGLKLGTLEQWRSQKKGPDYFKIGGCVRYHASEIEDWIESRRVRCWRPGER